MAACGGRAGICSIDLLTARLGARDWFVWDKQGPRAASDCCRACVVMQYGVARDWCVRGKQGPGALPQPEAQAAAVHAAHRLRHVHTAAAAAGLERRVRQDGSADTGSERPTHPARALQKAETKTALAPLRGQDLQKKNNTTNTVPAPRMYRAGQGRGRNEEYIPPLQTGFGVDGLEACDSAS